MSAAEYGVVGGDCAGENEVRAVNTFPMALAAVADILARKPRLAIVVTNYERADEGTNGLTESEEDALAGMISAMHDANGLEQGGDR